MISDFVSNFVDKSLRIFKIFSKKLFKFVLSDDIDWLVLDFKLYLSAAIRIRPENRIFLALLLWLYQNSLYIANKTHSILYISY